MIDVIARHRGDFLFVACRRDLLIFPDTFTQDGLQYLRFSLFFKTQLTREARSKKRKKKNKNVPACLPCHLLEVKEGIDSSRRVELGAFDYSLEICQNLDKSRKTGL